MTTAAQVKSAPQPASSSGATAWLLNSADAVSADAAVVVVRKGKASPMMACFPAESNPDPIVLAAAKQALAEKRVLRRIPVADSGSVHDFVVAVTCRISGRPAALGFRFNGIERSSEKGLYLDINQKVLRRADDPRVDDAEEPDELAGRKETADETDRPIQAPTEPTLPTSQSTAADTLVAPAVMDEQPTTLAAEILGEETGGVKEREGIQPVASKHNPLVLGVIGAEKPQTPQPANPDNLSGVAPSRLEASTQLMQTQGQVIDALAGVLDQENVERACYELCSQLSQTLRCQRVSLALVEGSNLVLKAMSNQVGMDARSAVVVDMLGALEETRQSVETVVLPPRQGQHPPPGHLLLMQGLKRPGMASIPLVHDEDVVGVLLLESDQVLEEQQIEHAEQVSLLLAPVLMLKTVENYGLSAWLKRSVWQFVKNLLGWRFLGLKVAALGIFVIALLASTVTQMFRVDAAATIEARTHRAVVAAFPSFLSEVDRKAGDVVTEGEVLGRLDVDELELDRLKWLGERDKLVKEHRASLAQRDRSKTRILEAQRAQAQSQIDLIDAQLERSILKAPISGVVVSGDLSLALGTPVDRGEKLFEVASLEDYRLILLVDEADIGWVEVGSLGSLKLRSLSDQSFEFTVTSITPVSEAASGANQFRVEAQVVDLPVSLRPGMEGVAKIEVAQRSIGWIWSRKFMNWMRLQTWKYGGF